MAINHYFFISLFLCPTLFIFSRSPWRFRERCCCRAAHRGQLSPLQEERDRETRRGCSEDALLSKPRHRHHRPRTITFAAMRVFAVSDIHTDYPENLEWIKSLTAEEFGGDALIVAGDVSDDEKTLLETFSHLSETFRHVFFVAGNHELYLRRGTRAGEQREEGEEAPAASGLGPGDGGGEAEAGSSGAGLPRPLRKFRDSLEKLSAINADLAALGVRTTPTLLDGAEVVFSSGQQGVGGREGGKGRGGLASDDDTGGEDDDEKKQQKKKRERKKEKRTSTPVWIVPILSWYHSAFDTEPHIPTFNADPRKIYTDFKACRWPRDLDPLTLNDGGEALASFFDQLNDPPLSSLTQSLQRDESRGSPRPVVIAFSHFLPFLELLPEKRFVTAPNLASVAGSSLLGERVASLGPDIHVFGHTHIPFDGALPSIGALGEKAGGGNGDGGGGEKTPTSAKTLPTRFVQAPLRYPAERRRSREGRGGSSPTRSRSYELQLIWDCGGGGGAESEKSEGESGSESEGDASEGEGGSAPRVVVERGTPGPVRSAFWTEYYAKHAREPENLELAPWVRPRVERYRNL